MCTVVILRRPDHVYPLVIGANRDEMKDRPWLSPARHWEDRPHVIGGLDEEAGGTWMAMNDAGVVACVLNRFGTLGPHPDYRSRGELPLEALDHNEAEEAIDSLSDLNPDAYRPFNMLIADYRSAWWLRNDGQDILISEINDGISMLTAHDMNDMQHSDRIKMHLPRFRQAPTPAPEKDDWMAWQALLASKKCFDNPRSAMEIETDVGFETVSSSLIALSKPWDQENKSKWHFCSGKPSEHDFIPIEINR